MMDAEKSREFLLSAPAVASMPEVDIVRERARLRAAARARRAAVPVACSPLAEEASFPRSPTRRASATERSPPPAIRVGEMEIDSVDSALALIRRLITPPAAPATAEAAGSPGAAMPPPGLSRMQRQAWVKLQGGDAASSSASSKAPPTPPGRRSAPAPAQEPEQPGLRPGLSWDTSEVEEREVPPTTPRHKTRRGAHSLSPTRSRQGCELREPGGRAAPLA